MKNKMILTMILILTMGASGCMFEEEKVEMAPKEWIEQGISKEDYFVNYMEERYGDEFVFKSDPPAPRNADVDQVVLTSVKYDRNVGIIRRYDTGEMHDTYAELYFRDEIEAVINPMMQELFPKSMVYYNTDRGINGDAGPEMTVEEYMQHDISKRFYIALALFIEDEEFSENIEENTEKIRAKFEENNYVGSITVYLVQESKFEEIDRSTYNSVFNNPQTGFEWHYLRGTIRMDSDFTVRYKEWRDIR